MGFLESLGKFMAKLAPGNAQTNWEDNLTLEQIEEMERQGCDMTEYRRKYEERIAAEDAKEAENVKNSLEALDMEKLKPYLATPRSEDGDFVIDTLKVNEIKEKNKQKIVDAPIVYGAVVQAHYALYEPGADGSFGAVFAFAMDEKHIHDEEWLRNLADKISEMKESSDVPADNKKFINTLRDDQSYFCFKLGESLCGDADAWCATFSVYNRNNLPLGYLPATKILPLLITEYPEVNQFAEFKYVPVKYYTK